MLNPRNPRNPRILVFLLLFASCSRARVTDAYPVERHDLELARRYAPVFHQRVAGEGLETRFDYITNFDFDRDWAGQNNWENAADSKFPMRAYVYYSVVESDSHYFITYATFHPRDWSAVGPLISTVLDQIQKSQKYGKYLPPELRQRLEVNHENDMEGAQVIVRKARGGEPERVESVETVAHDEFHIYLPRETDLQPSHAPDGALTLEQGRPVLYVESQKHGVHAWPLQHDDPQFTIFDRTDGPLLVYRYKGIAEDPATQKQAADIGYDLLPIYAHFWTKARGLDKPNETFGAVTDFADTFCRQLPESMLSRLTRNACRLGRVAVSFRGDVAGKNRAFLPWGWTSLLEPQLAQGEWFLNPVRVMRAHYPDAEFSDIYVSNPFLGVFRSE